MKQTFDNFVALRLSDASPASTEYKAMKSFHDSVRFEGVSSSDDDALYTWVATMIDKGIASSSRKRYIEKLGSIYKEYAATTAKLDDVDTFERIKRLHAEYDNVAIVDLARQTDRLAEISGTLLSDARSNPALALFLYMLFDASSDVERAAMLTTDDYAPCFAQLDDIIVPDDFHHRRRYVFSLDQSRHRVPGLVRDILVRVESGLATRDIRFVKGLTAPRIVAMWIARARHCGVTLADIRATVDTIPDEYAYLELVPKTDLTDDQRTLLLTRVADSFAPSRKRWYALKIRRGAAFDSICDDIDEQLQTCRGRIRYFYPQHEVAKRVNKKIVTETVPVIPDVVFFNVLPPYVRDIDRVVKQANLGWTFRTTNTPDSDYSVIDECDMRTFQQAIGKFTPDMTIELTDRPPMTVGRAVRITGGVMAGYQGRIYDIKDSAQGRRFYIQLSTAVAVKVEVNVDEMFIEPIDTL